MEETYICETCGKEYNVLNKIAHQIFCKNQKQRSVSNIKNDEPLDNIGKNEKIKLLPKTRAKSKEPHKSTIHSLFSSNINIKKEEPPTSNLKPKYWIKPKIVQ